MDGSDMICCIFLGELSVLEDGERRGFPFTPKSWDFLLLLTGIFDLMSTAPSLGREGDTSEKALLSAAASLDTGDGFSKGVPWSVTSSPSSSESECGGEEGGDGGGGRSSTVGERGGLETLGSGEKGGELRVIELLPAAGVVSKGGGAVLCLTFCSSSDFYKGKRRRSE